MGVLGAVGAVLYYGAAVGWLGVWVIEVAPGWILSHFGMGAAAGWSAGTGSYFLAEGLGRLKRLRQADEAAMKAGA